jgi:hypothetical protein
MSRRSLIATILVTAVVTALVTVSTNARRRWSGDSSGTHGRRQTEFERRLAGQ